MAGILGFAMGVLLLIAPATGVCATVDEAGIGTAVENRALVGQSESFDITTGKLYCFTKIQGANGTTIRHVWKRDGVIMADVSLPIGSGNWRTWSSKRFVAGMSGSWVVEVVSADGAVLEEIAFSVSSAANP